MTTITYDHVFIDVTSPPSFCEKTCRVFLKNAGFAQHNCSRCEIWLDCAWTLLEEFILFLIKIKKRHFYHSIFMKIMDRVLEGKIKKNSMLRSWYLQANIIPYLHKYNVQMMVSQYHGRKKWLTSCNKKLLIFVNANYGKVHNFIGQVIEYLWYLEFQSIIHIFQIKEF